MQDFFRINLGHVLIILVWLVTIVWGYSDLNTRVKNVEYVVAARGVAMEALRQQIIAESKETSMEARAAAASIAVLNAKISIIVNDTDWIKRNMK